MRLRFRTGTALVSQVLKRFDRAIEDLEVAGQQIQTRRAKKLTAVQATRAWVAQLEAQHRAEDKVLLDAYTRADKVRANITALVAS